MNNRSNNGKGTMASTVLLSLWRSCHAKSCLACLSSDRSSVHIGLFLGTICHEISAFMFTGFLTHPAIRSMRLPQGLQKIQPAAGQHSQEHWHPLLTCAWSRWACTAHMLQGLGSSTGTQGNEQLFSQHWLTQTIMLSPKYYTPSALYK